MSEPHRPQVPPEGVLLHDREAMLTRQRLMTEVMLGYQYAIDLMVTRLNFLQEDFNYAHDYNPIEGVSSRLKSAQSILDKAQRKGISLDLDSMREQILDIAGIRVTCAFVRDVYTVRDLLVGLPDVDLLEERDYIRNPKANGYKSLHLIMRVPVVRARGSEMVTVEIQLRTIAMDFWASLEHKIHYKYSGAVPEHLGEELRQAAEAAGELDLRMQLLHAQVVSLREQEPPPGRMVVV